MAAFFTELFRVDPADVDSLADPELEPNPETSIWLRHIGDLELVGLWELLPGAESDGTLMAEPLTETDAECVVLSIPSNFLQCVRELPESDIPGIIQRWNEMEELSHWTSENLTQLFISLRNLVSDAHAAGQVVVQRADF